MQGHPGRDWESKTDLSGIYVYRTDSFGDDLENSGKGFRGAWTLDSGHWTVEWTHMKGTAAKLMWNFCRHIRRRFTDILLPKRG
jgi:hypothetical protein